MNAACQRSPRPNRVSHLSRRVKRAKPEEMHRHGFDLAPCGNPGRRGIFDRSEGACPPGTRFPRACVERTPRMVASPPAVREQAVMQAMQAPVEIGAYAGDLGPLSGSPRAVWERPAR